MGINVDCEKFIYFLNCHVIITNNGKKNSTMLTSLKTISYQDGLNIIAMNASDDGCINLVITNKLIGSRLWKRKNLYAGKSGPGMHLTWK